MKMLAAISNKKAVGTTSAGGKINDKLVTARAENPKPLYPRITAAIKIAKTLPNESGDGFISLAEKFDPVATMLEAI